MEDREVQIATTESLFRDVNERIAETSEPFGTDEAEFMCECADPACADRLEVPLAEYEEVREDGTTFLLDPEHLEPDVERIERHRRGYAVVRKIDGIVARVARRLDPRAAGSTRARRVPCRRP
jgi:hypothetical protein